MLLDLLEALKIPRTAYDRLFDGNIHMGFEFEFAFSNPPRPRDDISRLWDLDEPDSDLNRGELLQNKVAEDLDQIVNQTVRVAHEHDADKGRYDEWWLEQDERVQSNNFSDYLPLELVSPVMDVAAGLTAINEVFEWANRLYSVETNRRTGFHVGLSYMDRRFMRTHLNPLKLLLLLGEDQALRDFLRRNNAYRASLLKLLRTNVRQRYSEFIQKDWKRIESFLLSKLPNYDHGRMNLGKIRDHGYVEFRIMGGSQIERKFQQVRQKVLEWSYLLKVACDDRAYQKDYLKKLYVFVQSLQNIPRQAERRATKVLSYYRHTIRNKEVLAVIVRFLYRMEDWLEEKDSMEWSEVGLILDLGEQLHQLGQNDLFMDVLQRIRISPIAVMAYLVEEFDSSPKSHASIGWMYRMYEWSRVTVRQQLEHEFPIIGMMAQSIRLGDKDDQTHQFLSSTLPILLKDREDRIPDLLAQMHGLLAHNPPAYARLLPLFQIWSKWLGVDLFDALDQASNRLPG